MKRVATLMLWLQLGVPALGQGQTIDRLFFSAAEREALEARRRAPQPISATESKSFDGYLASSSGVATIWVSGMGQRVRIESRASYAASGAQRSGVVAISTGGGAGRVTLRVGGTLDATEQTPRDVLETGAVTRRR